MNGTITARGGRVVSTCGRKGGMQGLCDARDRLPQGDRVGRTHHGEVAGSHAADQSGLCQFFEPLYRKVHLGVTLESAAIKVDQDMVGQQRAGAAVRVGSGMSSSRAMR